MRSSSTKYHLQIDQQLKNQYHEICFNPKKRQILLRLRDQNEELAQEGFTIQKLNRGGFSNNMLKRYIHGIYEQYGIQDPIQRQFRLAKKNQILINGSPEKSLNLTQVTQSDRLTKTKKKIINLKQSFKQDNQDIIQSSIIQTQANVSLRQSNFLINRSRIGKQIGYKTKQKIYFKTLPKDDVIKQIPRQIVKHQFSVQRSDHSKITISFNNPENVSTSKKEIPTVFRYCPMCQQLILQENISHHQSICKDIQKAYELPYSTLQQIVINKIQRIERELSDEFINKDERSMIIEFNHLKQLVKSWVRLKNNASYDEVKNCFQNFAVSAHEKILKLNWFKNLYKKITIQRSHQSPSSK